MLRGARLSWGAMRSPKVSVVVGVYNKERHVGECLRSVLAQTRPDFELVVVDDASTDGSRGEIQMVRDDRIRFVQMPRNSGHPGVPRNRGIGLARGEYLAFLDADDVWMPEKLEKQVAYMDSHPEFAITHTRCMVMDGEGREIYLRHGGNYPPPGDVFAELMKHCFICTSTVMLRKELTDQIGVFSEEPCFKSGQDCEFFARCARVSPVGMPDGVLAKYRNVPDTVSRRAANWRSLPRDYVRHRIFWRRRALWAGQMTEPDMRRIAYCAAEENANHWRGAREFRKAAWFAGQMICLAPGNTMGWRQLAAAGLRRGG